MISINALKTLNHNGKVYSQGTNPVLGSGCGGPTGGSIYVQTSIIKGTGIFNIQGGNGVSPNGGGGSGG